MKKLYTTPEYKLKHKRRLRKFEIRIRVNRSKLRSGRSGNNLGVHEVRDTLKPPVIAPSDLRLMENTAMCLRLFRDMRSTEYLSRKRHFRYIILSLKYVTQIDYGTISIITAISDDLNYRRIILRMDLPDDPDCRKFMIDSGFLNNMFNEYGKPFPKSEKSELIFFEKGSGVLSEQDNMKISLLVKQVVNHLTGESKYCLAVKTIILEICGNSIEWSGTDSKQWLLGVKYEDHKVVFTVTDVGKGILDTLNRKFKLLLRDLFTLKTHGEILKGAFEKKYGSSTREVNRNKGLPAVKANFDQSTIKALKVLTNNVILHFDKEEDSRTFEKGLPRFKGTFYQWEMNIDCLNKIVI